MNVKQRLAVMAAAAALVAAAVLGLWLSGIHERAADVEPSPFSGNEAESESPDGFPTVDWEYWLSVNPDIVAWVSVAGTEIDYPVVQARSDDPTFYLDHDVYREWNPYGCPYLDAACAGQGIDSPLALMFAHHMNDGSMFSAFASYSDAGFAVEHDEILLQTPEGNERLRVVAADVVDSNAEYKRLDFATGEELSSWLDELLGGADVALVDDARTDSVKAFCTCSYGRWNGHERTIVYAQEEVG
ncbi:MULTISPECIES: class B sortase [Coriobacteriia]|uniref:class B sortase n=1 Tax=Coriobacteriia TaxID=84998 RepID=UPI001F415237|nr:class B sortase [Eggerthella lenta]